MPADLGVITAAFPSRPIASQKTGHPSLIELGRPVPGALSVRSNDLSAKHQRGIEMDGRLAAFARLTSAARMLLELVRAVPGGAPKDSTLDRVGRDVGGVTDRGERPRPAPMPV